MVLFSTAKTPVSTATLVLFSTAISSPCTRPTTRQVIDVFDLVNRHTLADPNRDTVQIFTTELAPIHQQILKLLGIDPEAYRT